MNIVDEQNRNYCMNIVDEIKIIAGILLTMEEDVSQRQSQRSLQDVFFSFDFKKRDCVLILVMKK